MSVGGPGFMFGGHLFLSLLLFGFLVVAVVVIAVIVMAVHASTRTAYPTGAPPMQMGAAPPPARETPLEILARRFASGEITAEEYQRARDLLEGGGKT
jgi:putative membrane protein